MNRIIPKFIEKKDKQIKEDKEQTKEPKRKVSVLETTKHVFAGAAAVGLLGGVLHGAGLMTIGPKQNLSQEELNKFLTVKGYHAANYNYKAKQIRQLIIDCNIGLISYEELAEGIKDKNLTELDFDVFAKENLDEDQYAEYLELKADYDKKTDKLHGHGNGALASSCLALLMASGVVSTQAIINLKKKRAKKKAEKEEERRSRQEKLAQTIAADDIDD